MRNQQIIEKSIGKLSFEDKLKLYDLFSEYGSDNKKRLFDENIHQRTKYITVLMENVYHGLNASAVIRTADCFGIQDVYVVEKESAYKVDTKIAMGASKWVDIYRLQDTQKAYQELRNKGYQIVAATPHEKECLLGNLSVEKPIALVLGNEKEGLSDLAVAEADVRIKIPMYGFTESLNVSVSAALCLHHLTEKIRKTGINWQLSHLEKIDLKIAWLRKSVRSADEVLWHLLEKNFSEVIA